MPVQVGANPKPVIVPLPSVSLFTTPPPCAPADEAGIDRVRCGVTS